MKKANWSRIELIATLDLYFTIPFTKINYKNPEIKNMSNILGRTPSAIALKLVNFARFDPELKKRNVSGMRHGGKREEEIWNEFYGKWDDLAYESERILASLKHESIELI